MRIDLQTKRQVSGIGGRGGVSGIGRDGVSSTSRSRNGGSGRTSRGTTSRSIFAETITVGDKIDRTIWLRLTTSIGQGFHTMARGIKGASELWTPTLENYQSRV